MHGCSSEALREGGTWHGLGYMFQFRNMIPQTRLAALAYFTRSSKLQKERVVAWAFRFLVLVLVVATI